ncbi:hypothetical protein U6A24_07160 [Aquimarina gracilis]|uniref:Uncharacterized protein n=1 Tax=Aquimarina gracilis TaxID=874422 RepID=A0ABU5ZT12_9FLAO|nr:hypothetical protein [Aquimarina gracilis]MEB3345230.1 hypothetical protein [Aquimarina gracilis]
MNVNNKKFRAIANKEGLSSQETVFHYFQNKNVITGTYKGGQVLEGFVVGRQTENNKIELLFQCVTTDHELLSGESTGTIIINKDSKLELMFDWSWLNGDRSGGKSHYIEIE